MFRIISIICLFFGAGILKCLSQAVDSAWLVESWDTDDGLPQNSVVSLAQTPDGRLWVGSLLGGVASFDGVKFRVYDPSNTPQLRGLETFRLIAGADGTLWVSQLDGSFAGWRDGAFFDAGRDDWLGKRPVAKLFGDSALELMVVRQLGEILVGRAGEDWQLVDLHDADSEIRYFHRDKKGRLYYRSQKLGLSWWHDGQHGQVRLDGLQGNSVRAMATDLDGRIWIGTESGIGEIVDGQLVDRTPSSGSGFVVQMEFAGDGGLWVRGLHRLRRYQDGKWTTVVDGLPDEVLGAGRPLPLQILRAPEGGLWLLQRHAGVWHVSRAGTATRLGSQDGLPGGLVECGLVDLEDNLWIGLNGGGLARARPRFLQSLDFLGDLPPVVRSICRGAGDEIWMGYSDGRLARLDLWRAEGLPLPPAVPSRDVTVWRGNQNDLWIGTVGNGAWQLRDGSFTRPFEPAAIGQVVRAGITDSVGRVWIGSGTWPLLFEDGRLKRHRSADGFPQEKYVVALAEGQRVRSGSARQRGSCIAGGTVSSISGSCPMVASSDSGHCFRPTTARCGLERLQVVCCGGGME